jgi:antitoxin VapB
MRRITYLPPHQPLTPAKGGSKGLSGESQTAAVETAVRERLSRLRRLRGAGLAHRLLAIGADTAHRLPDELRTADHGDLLYGEDGLPR